MICQRPAHIEPSSSAVACAFQYGLNHNICANPLVTRSDDLCPIEEHRSQERNKTFTTVYIAPGLVMVTFSAHNYIAVPSASLLHSKV